jgi:recombination protein RecR
MTADNPIETLIAAFSKLPGIGAKTAARLTFFVLRSPPTVARDLAHALLDAVETIVRCERCRTYTTAQPCPLCANPARDGELICVVESVADQWAIERSAVYRGLYHVLHGTIAPLDGVGPDALEIASLLTRVEREKPREVIVATNSDVNGETTALYVSQLLAARGIRVSRIASGIPSGGGLEYVDTTTLETALTYRRPFSERP